MRRTRSHSLAELRVSLGLDKQEAVGGLPTALRNGTTVHYAVAWVKYYRIAFCQTGQYLGYPAIPVAYRDRPSLTEKTAQSSPFRNSAPTGTLRTLSAFQTLTWTITR